MALTQATEPDSQAMNEEATEYPMPPIKELTLEESRALFDELTRDLLGISGDEFVRRYDAGRYDDILDDGEHFDLLYLAMVGGLGAEYQAPNARDMALRCHQADESSTCPDSDDAEDFSVLPVQRLTLIDGQAFFDTMARQLLGMSGDEFIRRYHTGRYDDILDDPDHSDLMYLAMLGGLGW